MNQQIDKIAVLFNRELTKHQIDINGINKNSSKCNIKLMKTELETSSNLQNITLTKQKINNTAIWHNRKLTKHKMTKM